MHGLRAHPQARPSAARLAQSHRRVPCSLWPAPGKPCHPWHLEEPGFPTGPSTTLRATTKHRSPAHPNQRPDQALKRHATAQSALATAPTRPWSPRSVATLFRIFESANSSCFLRCTRLRMVSGFNPNSSAVARTDSQSSAFATGKQYQTPTTCPATCPTERPRRLSCNITGDIAGLPPASAHLADYFCDR